VFGVGPIRFHWFLGREAFQFVLHDQASAFGNAGAYGFLEPIGGPTALIATDDPEHLRRRRAVQPAFHGRLVAAWTERASLAFDAFAIRALADGSGPLVPALRPVVLDVVLDVLLGEGARHRRPGLARDLAAMMSFANRPMLAQQFRVAVPGSPWASFLAARRRADEAIRAEIRARRAGDVGDEAGVLGWLLTGDADPATRLDESELRDQTISLLAAGFDTTTAAIAWTAYHLARSDLRAPVADELRELEPAAAVRAPATGALVQETLRLYPPASAILRRVRRDVAWREHLLPAGARVGLSLWHLHRDPRTWTDPERVEPRRWTDGHGAWAAPRDPFAYLPFGYGGRLCIGAGLAHALTTSFVWAALRRASWDVIDSDSVRPVGTTLTPSRGLRLRWRAR
jgi:cytochrome P450